MAQATLRTHRLHLVPLSDDHLGHEIELDADPAVMRYLGNGRPNPPAEVVNLHRKRLATANIVPGLGYWTGFADGRFVGWWILEPPQRADQGPLAGQAELGYRLMRSHWRQGLAGEGSRELLRYAFENLGLHRVFAETMAVNTGSRATMASIGMRHVRTFYPKWDEPLPGSDLGEVEYAITREEWFTQRAADRPNGPLR